jgi:hypothetical protein
MGSPSEILPLYLPSLDSIEPIHFSVNNAEPSRVVASSSRKMFRFQLRADEIPFNRDVRLTLSVLVLWAIGDDTLPKRSRTFHAALSASVRMIIGNMFILFATISLLGHPAKWIQTDQSPKQPLEACQKPIRTGHSRSRGSTHRYIHKCDRSRGPLFLISESSRC